MSQSRQVCVFPNFHPCSLPQFDVLFSDLESQQRVLTESDQLLSSCRRKVERALGLATTIKKAEAEDVVTALLLCYSASCGGDLGQIEFSVSNRIPYIHVRKDGLIPEFQHCAEAWEEFIGQVTEIAHNLDITYETVTRLLSDARRLSTHAEALLQETKFSPRECNHTLLQIKENMETATRLPKRVKDAFQAASVFDVYCRSLLEEYSLENKLRFIKEAGQSAAEEGVKDVRQLMEQFYLAQEDFAV